MTNLATDLEWRHPRLTPILQDAARGGDWMRMSRLRAEVRALGLTGTDLAVAIGLIDDMAPANVTPLRDERKEAA